jgi:AcrR family transcriptional regulator
VAKPATAEKRQRRERGSINPDDIIKGAFELAEELGIDNVSMPLLGKHLGVGVTSIYWYFRKKDELLNAMTDRALKQYVFATPYVEAKDWRETLRNHARSIRKTFLGNPILCDLILIRSALSPRAAKLGAAAVEKAIESLVEAGLSPDDAFDTYSAVSVHVRGSVVLQRLYEKNHATTGQTERCGPSDRRLRRQQLRVRLGLHPRPRRATDRAGICQDACSATTQDVALTDQAGTRYPAAD